MGNCAQPVPRNVRYIQKTVCIFASGFLCFMGKMKGKGESAPKKMENIVSKPLKIPEKS